MPAATDVASATGALVALARDPAVSYVHARTRHDLVTARDIVTVEIVRNGRLSSDGLLEDPADLQALVVGLLGSGRACGAVAVRGLHGIAAVPPAAEAPLLVLERWRPARAEPDTAAILPPTVATAAAAVLRAGAGVVVAGPRGPYVESVLRAITARLEPSIRLVVLHDGPHAVARRDAIRLREAPYEVLTALRHSVAIVDRTVPPCLPLFSGPALIVASGRTPEAALARLTSGSTASPALLATMCADAAPLMLWFAPHARGATLHAVYEILPEPALRPRGLPALQMLGGTDPTTRALVPTGAVPTDRVLRAAFAP